jgi:hypothetical protein
MHRLTTLERAFQLADEGKHPKVADIRRALTQEGYPDVAMQIAGGTLMRQLRARLLAARSSSV